MTAAHSRSHSTEQSSRRTSARRTPSLRRAAAVGVVASVAGGLLLAGPTAASASASAAVTASTSSSASARRTVGVGATAAHWTSPHGKLFQGAGRDSHALYVQNVNRRPQAQLLNDRTNSVLNTVAGGVYQVSAYVRSSSPRRTLTLRVMEYRPAARGARWTYEGQSVHTVLVRDNRWHAVTLTYRARTAHANLDVNVLSSALPTRGFFGVSGVRLTIPVPVTTPTPTPTPSPVSSGPSLPVAVAGYHQVWGDDFNGTSLNAQYWSAMNNSTYGDGNKELECLTDRASNLQESDGTLKIIGQRESSPYVCGSHDTRFPAGRDYTSAFIQTAGKVAFKYGYFEIRAKLPTQAGSSQGMWPAFWLRPASGGIGELDALEAIGSNSTGSSEASTVHQTIWYDYTGTYAKQTHNATAASALASGFHTYGVDWEAGSITWYVDGQPTYQRTTATTPWLDSAFGQAFYIKLNMAIGGSWPGSPTAATAFPATYAIDYIHVYQR